MLPIGPGQRLGIYEVTAELGAGGMGRVFRARDTRLNRDVALKVLPETVANDSERLARFAREAQTLAALNHPNIAAIYGFESGALVMELVEGEDLSVVIARGPIAVAEAVLIARQIADALESAHAQGIIHRDLKPANIKVRADGTVKILDFGLAKAMTSEAASTSADAMNLPTITTPAMTQAGMILGTAAYMSPEQARGKVVDKRADIWAFGAVVFEMLTGERAFPGDDVTDTLAAVVRGEPDWTRLPKDAPRMLVLFLQRCLQKDPKQRLGDIHDMRLALDGAFDVAATSTAAGAPIARPAQQARTAWVAFGAMTLVTLAIAAYAFFGRAATSPTAPTQWQIVPPEGFSFAALGSAAQISPDGTRIVMMGKGGLWLRASESGQTTLMPGTEGATYPFWSPDSRNIGFFHQGRLKRVAAAGGPILDLCASATTRGGAWSKNDVILFAPGPSAGLFRVSASGGTPEIVVKPTPGLSGEYIRYPSFMPDGHHFLFQHSTPTDEGFMVGDLDGSAPRKLRSDFSSAVFAPPTGGATVGRLLFMINRRTLVSQAFDANTLQLSGEITPVAEAIGSAGNFGNGGFSVSNSGTLVYAPSAVAEGQITIVDRSGAAKGVIGSPVFDPMSVWSPDATRVAYIGAVLPESTIVIQQVSGGPPTSVASSHVTRPLWLSETRVAFARSGLRNELVVKHLDGAAQEEPLGVAASNAIPTDRSSDGKWLAYQASDNVTGTDLFLLPLVGERKPVVFLQTAASESEARFSPDGRWMAYAQVSAARNEVFIQAIASSGSASGIQYRVSSAGGQQPIWRSNGTELVYVSADGAVTSVPVTLGATVLLGTPRVLFSLPAGARVTDAAPDLQRFLVTMPTAAGRATTLTVVLNWQGGTRK